MAARASRPWRRAAAVALAVHVVLFGLAIRSVKIMRPPAEPAAIGLQLIQLQPPPRPRRPRPARPAPSPAPSSPLSAATRPTVAAPALPAPAPASPSPPADDAAGRVRAMLRGSSGCDSAAFLNLSEAERRKCEQWRTAHLDPNLRIPARVAPVKKDWFDASLQARERANRPQFGHPRPPRLIGGSCGGGSAQSDSIKLGPCRIGIAGMFNDDDVPPP